MFGKMEANYGNMNPKSLPRGSRETVSPGSYVQFQQDVQGSDAASEQLIDLQQPIIEDYALEDPLSEALYIVNEKPSGSYRVTGMFENMDQGGSVNQLLERPRISFFDLSWSNW